MSLSLTQLEDDVYEMVGMNEDDLSRVKVRSFLNRAYWQLTKTLKFRETDQIFSFGTSSGVNFYLFESYVGDFSAIRRVTIYDTPNNGTYALPVVQTDYANLMDDAQTDNLNRAIPTKYARYNEYITFNYIPQDTYTVNIFYEKSLGDIQSAGPGIPEEWHETLLYGASARIFFDKGSATKAQIAFKQQADMIQLLVPTEVKEERDYSMSSVRPIRRRYP
jgi:hypothetical protein